MSCHVLSCRIASPGQVTSRHMPSPLVRLFAPCPCRCPLLSCSSQLVLSCLISPNLLSSHIILPYLISSFLILSHLISELIFCPRILLSLICSPLPHPRAFSPPISSHLIVWVGGGAFCPRSQEKHGPPGAMVQNGLAAPLPLRSFKNDLPLIDLAS